MPEERDVQNGKEDRDPRAGGAKRLQPPRGNVAARGAGGNVAVSNTNVYGGAYRPYYGYGASAAGLAVGFVNRGQRTGMIVNVAAARAEGADLDSAFLAVAEIADKR